MIGEGNDAFKVRNYDCTAALEISQNYPKALNWRCQAAFEALDKRLNRLILMTKHRVGVQCGGGVGQEGAGEGFRQHDHAGQGEGGEQS